MLMCYLRVCPFIKPLGERCTIEKVDGQCCPSINCPDVVDLDQDLDAISTTTTTTTTTSTTTSTTTAKPTSILSQSIQFSREGCEMDGFHYNDGDLIPSDPAKPCEICYCIQNRSMCTLQECRLEGVTGCEPIYQRNTCCPVKYDCCNKTLVKITSDGEKKRANKRPKVKTRLVPGEGVCRYEKKIYQNGHKVNSTNPCMEYCMCINSVVYCDEITCQEDSARKNNKNCREIHNRNRCCPRYECKEYDYIEQTDISDLDVPHKTGLKIGIKKKPMIEIIETTTTKAPAYEKTTKIYDDDTVTHITLRPIVEEHSTVSVMKIMKESPIEKIVKISPIEKERKQFSTTERPMEDFSTSQTITSQPTTSKFDQTTSSGITPSQSSSDTEMIEDELTTKRTTPHAISELIQTTFQPEASTQGQSKTTEVYPSTSTVSDRDRTTYEPGTSTPA
ncbi:tenectin-like protein, partial [Sarcoptes scabiei]